MELDSNLDENTFNFVSENPAHTQMSDVISLVIKRDLKNESSVNFREACRVLNSILSNIIKDPKNEKFLVIKENNPKFQSYLGKYDSAKFLLEILGFERIVGEENIFCYTKGDLSLLSM